MPAPRSKCQEASLYTSPLSSPAVRGARWHHALRQPPTLTATPPSVHAVHAPSQDNKKVATPHGSLPRSNAGRPTDRPRSGLLLPPVGRMGSLGGGGGGVGGARRPRFLCLHGFRTSGDIMRKQVVGKWPAHVTARLDLVFPDAPFPAEAKSAVEGIFDGPYYEWFQFDEGFTEYRNLDKCFDYIEELMITQGPFDGLMGFSQGSVLSGALVGLQEQGLALTRVPKIKFLVIIGGARFRSPTVSAKAYANMIKIPSLHFLGDHDFLKSGGEELIESFVDPFIIRHPKGHTVPRIVDEKSLEVMSRFLDKMEKELSENSSTKTEASADVDEKEICI